MMWPATVTPWAWAVAAVIIAFLELPVPGSYLIWIACAAGLTALAGFVNGWSLSAQLTFFVVACIGTCIAGYFVYRQLDQRGKETAPVTRSGSRSVRKIWRRARPLSSGRPRARP